MPDGRVNRDTFEGYDVDSKLMTLFDYAVSTDGRLTKLEHKMIVRPALMGFVGGAFMGLMVYLKTLVGK